jgi:hypothetical protein
MNEEDYQQFEGHVYLDISNPFVAWNVSRGGFVSADVLAANGGLSENSLLLSPWSEPLFREGNELKREVDFRLETLRKAEFAGEVSRLACIFIFGSVEDAAAVWDTSGWGARFDPANLADCGVQARAVSRLDANWIEQMVDGDGRLANDWEAKARSYWSGCPVPDQEPVWETMVSGEITIWGTDLKDRGLAILKEQYPHAETAWCYSELAFDIGSLDGIAAPIAVAHEDRINIEIRFRFVDGQDANFRRELALGKLGHSGKIRHFPETRCFQFPPIKNRVSSECSYSFDLRQLLRSN